MVKSMITYKEKGHAYGRDYIQDYVDIYTQPLHNRIMAWLYHSIWEKLTWRIYRLIEKRWPVKDRYEDKQDIIGIPLTNRQDLRCFDLHRKNRVTIEVIYGEKISREK